ncbi:MAG: VOC family protein [Anaerolineae bacterium]|nr:VOC family protein [Chloroflexota bacterium]MBP6298084.1 VOC family protein [Anaerolineae bacterium]
MSVNAVTHLNFGGNARQALGFYHSVFGGNLSIMTYADFGAPKDTPGADQVVWGQVAADSGFRVMAYDVPMAEQPPQLSEPSTRRENGMTITRDSFFISLRGADVDEISRLWEKLSVGAVIVEPIAQSQWSPLFGMLTDRFGTTWVVDVVNQYNAS